MSEKFFNKNTFKGFKKSMVKYGTMFIASQVLVQKFYPDSKWRLNTVGYERISHMLVGFAAYELFIKQLYPNTLQNPIRRAIYDDWLAFGSMFLISRILDTRLDGKNIGKALSDRIWINSVLHTLIGLAIYHLMTKELIPSESDDKLTKKVIDSNIKFGTMLVFSSILSLKRLDTQWLMEVVFILAGFSFGEAIWDRFQTK